MKKMLIGAVAMAAGIAMADGISSDIVGYTTVDLVPGDQVMKGASFVSVGDDELDLQDIKMDAACPDSGAEIWWWNGSTYDARAYWFTDLYADESGETTLGYAGWGDEMYWMPISKTFAPGEAFWIQANGGLASASVTLAGQVAVASSADQYYGIPLTPGEQVQLTNPFPTGSLNIQSIKMSDNVPDSGAEIWWWNGATYDARAYWFTDLYADESGETTLGYAGWGDEMYWMPISKTFTDGTGFWIQANGGLESATVKFPNPFYVAP